MEYFFYSVICLCMIVLAISSTARNMQYDNLEADMAALDVLLREMQTDNYALARANDELSAMNRQLCAKTEEVLAKQASFLAFCNMPRNREVKS